MTKVNYIGHGEHSIEELFAMLEKHTLDPRFEEYGNFMLEDDPSYGGDYLANWSKPGNEFRFWGNFYDYSFVFSIDTTDAGLILALESAIRRNQATDRYAQAKIEEAA